MDKFTCNAVLLLFFDYYFCRQLIDILGEKGDLEVEKSAILADNSLDSTPYNDRLLSELRSDYTLLPEDLNGREDWRKSCIFTIDPATAVDLDDALSCRLLDNGNYEVLHNS